MNHLAWRSSRTLACTALALTLSAWAQAGVLDTPLYRLSYDDALGTPMRSFDAGIATYTFEPFSRSGQDAMVGIVDEFLASLTAAPGLGFRPRPDATLPVWAEVRVDSWSYDPHFDPPPTQDPYPIWAFGSSGDAYGDAQVTSAGAGVDPQRVDVRMKSVVSGLGAHANVWYGVDCNYHWNDPCTTWEWVGYEGSAVHVEATFTPVIYVDERLVTGVPEPGTCGLALFGLAFVGGVVRMRRQAG